MKRNVKEPNREKVESLKDKVRQDKTRPVLSSGATIESVWYGPQTENQRAGIGEFG